MPDYANFKLGGVEYPVSASPFVESLEKLDPPIFIALKYFKAMLEKHLGDYFDAAATAAGMPHLVGKIVAEVMGQDPIRYLQDAQEKLPWLALYRTEEEFKDHTASWYKSTSKWTLLYVLPPLSAGQAQQIIHILKGVRAVLLDRTIQGYDPDYNSGEEVWGTAGVMSIGIESARYGTPNLGTDLFFPTLERTMVVEEREQKNPGLDDFTGLDGKIDVSDGDPINDVTVAEFSRSST